MSNTAPRPFLMESQTKADSPAPEQPGFDPLLVLRAGCVDAPPSDRGASVRRRASQQQGQALETIGHAIEYLIDTRMFELAEHNRAAEAEAVQMLMRLSREVFDECVQVVTLRGRLEQLIQYMAR